MPACAYTVTLRTDVLLTKGESTPGVQYDWVSFCKR
jgi:hypothetical protein